jgi:hypothetical protein
MKRCSLSDYGINPSEYQWREIAFSVNINEEREQKG